MRAPVLLFALAELLVTPCANASPLGFTGSFTINLGENGAEGSVSVSGARGTAD